MALTDETVVEIKDAPQHYPTPVSLATTWRHALRGIDGIKLETAKVGRKRFTSVEAIGRFVEALTAADEARRAQASGDDEPSAERPPELQRRMQKAGLA